MKIINPTPYVMERSVLLDRGGRESLLAIVKGTFRFGPGVTEVAEEQVPITQADEYYDEPQNSSIALATDLLPPRPTTGVTLSGCAVARKGPVEKMPVGIRLGNLVQKAWVFGDRIGYHNISHPAPFEKMPLTWENAFGGVDMTPEKQKHHAGHDDNPVGRGFIASHSKIDPATVRLPNIENPDHLLRSKGDKPPAIGFGPVAPFWVARSRYGGTYDDAWVRERAPLLPDDFDERFLQAAPAQLTADSYLEGGEPVEILGMTEEGRIQFSLPDARPTLGIRLARRGIRTKPPLESVHIDTEARTVTLTWKSLLDVQGQVEELKSVEARLLG